MSLPKLLALELWGLGDLAIATPFLRAASEQFEVTLLAKPHATDLQSKLWPGVNVIPVTAPWTAFTGKYQIWNWPWRELRQTIAQLRREQFDIAVSARWDPRDHALMRFAGARELIGFPRKGSESLLTRSLIAPHRFAHRHDYWRVAAEAVGVPLAKRENLPDAGSSEIKCVLLHSGAGQPVRVWPLVRCQAVVNTMRERGLHVQVACDADQLAWWRENGETEAAAPETISELVELLEGSDAFVGNDSGPGHLAAQLGRPTFTIFGPQLPESFLPLHPRAEFVEGKPCPHKPCFDSCQLPQPYCLLEVSFNDVWPKLAQFLHVEKASP